MLGVEVEKNSCIGTHFQSLGEYPPEVQNTPKYMDPRTEMHSILCSVQGYSAEYADLDTYFGAFCLILDVYRTSVHR
jgi:hypothetical protein